MKAETLQATAELLILRCDAIRLIDGAGPNIEVSQSAPTEQESRTEPECTTKPLGGQQNTTKTVEEQAQTRTSPNRRKEDGMSTVHSIEFTPPITHPERFATWSRDVQKVLDYLPRYVAAGRKQRIFALPWEEVQRHMGEPLLEIISDYYEHHHLQPLILPNQRQVYEQFIQQLPVSLDTEQKPFLPMNDYEEDLNRFYGGGPMAFGWPKIPGKGRYLLVAIEKGGREPLPIRGLDGTGEPIVTETKVAFNLDLNNRDTDTREYDDPFWVNLEDLLEENEDASSRFGFWKGPHDPHDLVVQAALIRLNSHIPEIDVSSELQPDEWWEASLLCQKLFGRADLPPGVWGDRSRPGEEARRKLVHLANSLPD